jgi:AcrR family transcriptional regulator
LLLFEIRTVFGLHIMSDYRSGNNYCSGIVGHMVETRRERHRRELVDEILTSARQQLDAGGRTAVSLRAIARDVGVSPASMYTYFASLDDVFTELIVESFSSLATALESARASADDPIDRLLAVADTYRCWALDNPAQFNLVFTDQLGGYQAPSDGRTIDAEISVLKPIHRSIGDIIGLPAGPATELDAAEQEQLTGVYGLIHGLVMLDVNGHGLPGLDHRSLLRSALARAVNVDDSIGDDQAH